MPESTIAPQSACPQLCLLLMRRFRVPTPGVRLRHVHFSGYSAPEVKRGFRYLRRRRVLAAAIVLDADGVRYGGHLVSLTALGQAVLKMMEAWPGPRDVPTG